MAHSEQSLRTAAVECYRNATNLHRSAEILYRAHRLEHALALARIGIEEFAKLVVYTVAALCPGDRDRVRGKIGGHHTKSWVFSQVRDCMMKLRQTERGFTLVECFTDLAKLGLSGLLLTDREAREQYVQRNEGRLNPAELKDDALYVDLTVDGTLRVPRAVGRLGFFAELYVALLSNHLRQFAELPDWLTNDHDWNAFANGVRCRIDGVRGRR